MTDTRTTEQMMFDRGDDRIPYRNWTPECPPRSTRKVADLSRNPTFRENTREMTRRLFEMGDDRVPSPNYDPLA